MCNESVISPSRPNENKKKTAVLMTFVDVQKSHFKMEWTFWKEFYNWKHIFFSQPTQIRWKYLFIYAKKWSSNHQFFLLIYSLTHSVIFYRLVWFGFKFNATNIMNLMIQFNFQFKYIHLSISMQKNNQILWMETNLTKKSTDWNLVFAR